MRARTAPALLLLGVAVLGVGASACGSSDEPAGTVDDAITVGTNEVAVGGGDSAAATDAAPATSEAAAGGAEGDPAAGKTVFSANCAGCHTLADAGAAGAVGPNLDDLKPDAARVSNAVINGMPGGMPPFGGQLSEDDIKNVAAYVASVAGA